MAGWSDISLQLYKDFSTIHLFPKIFRYHLANNTVIDVAFKEWAMHHLWAIHHIDYRIDKHNLFNKIDAGLSFATFARDRQMKRRLMDYRDRLRMFSCIYMILKTGTLFYVHNGVLSGTKVKIDYIKSEIIDTKGVNIGMRYEDGVYVPITMLIDRAINPTKTTQGLSAIPVLKLEIIERGAVIETITPQI